LINHKGQRHEQLYAAAGDVSAYTRATKLPARMFAAATPCYRKPFDTDRHLSSGSLRLVCLTAERPQASQAGRSSWPGATASE
jgi:hypothetical protein